MLPDLSTAVWVGIILGLGFDFLNGMNDAANSIATVVSTRVLKPWMGVLWAAVFNLIGALVFGTAVAITIGKGIIDPNVVTSQVVLSALVGAIIWTWACTHLGLPISASHALIGGLAGSAWALKGSGSLIWSGILKVSAFIFIAPLLGMVLGMIIMIGVTWLSFKWTPKKGDYVYRKMQLLSAATYSLSHGTNDAQKTMGIISLLLYLAARSAATAHGQNPNSVKFIVPDWVIFSATAAIALGTMTGGWKVIRTMGMKLTKLRPISGFAAETAGSLSVFTASALGIPVSTTHTIAGAIMGVGTVTNIGAVRWGMVSNIVWAWILTIPTSAAIGALVAWVSTFVS